MLKRLAVVAAGAVLVLLVRMGVTLGRMASTLDKVVLAIEHDAAQRKGKRVTEYKDSWQSGGVTKCVTTQCMPGETIEDCEARHDAAVKRRMASCPPD